MKDETADMVIKEFIGLHSKMYSYTTDHKSLSKIKRLSRNTIKDIKKCKTLKECIINKITTQADLSLRWAHSHFVCFVMSRLI